MERDGFSSEGSTQGQAGGSNAGGSVGNSGNVGGAQGYGAGSTANVGQGFSTGSADSQSGQGLSDRARDIAGNAQEKLADVGSNVRERAGNLKNSLADALETGADRLRQRGGSGSLAGAGSTGSVAIDGDGRMAQVSGRVAGGLDATAGWLRDADLDGVRTGIERQVREHPGRSLLIAVGLGYLIGKAIRK